jgi:KipI family sensor histidine kinase inhibitor
MSAAPTPRLEPLGDSALLLHWDERIDIAINACVHALAARLREAALPGLLDIVPAYASILLRFDPLRWEEVRLREYLVTGAAQTAPDATTSAASIVIPVCYGGECGPDLTELADHSKLSVEAVIAQHCGAAYRVAMLGFAPGFPYLLGLPPALHAPRRATPRTRVPAGSVAIGGAQTGIYPRELPGGWQLIGRTPLPLFDLTRHPPALLAPGDCVRFRAIDALEFAALRASSKHPDREHGA